MNTHIEPYSPRHLHDVVDLSLRAWAPVFESIRATMDTDVYRSFYPEGWQTGQGEAVEAMCRGDDIAVWVAIQEDVVAGFVAVKLQKAEKMGEIYMIAVDPRFQRRGIGSALMDHAVDWMKGEGMSVAMVETGGDSGHTPARQLYERAGFRLWPVARYFKKL